MKLTKSAAYGRFKLLNGALFIALGALVLAQMLHGIGFRLEALPGILLGLALIGLGVVRWNAFFKDRAH
ncbi:MAG: hypothetical protein M3Z14_04125 [Candidatus Eremiobacteraeota bacterium]|nr:hypothetical protein [Candidatus Eremiobacteraeota bacterium]